MTPFRKRTSKCWFVTITTRAGTYVRRSSGTRDKATAAAMQTMLTGLSRRGTHTWDLIDAVVEKRLAIGDLFDHHAANTLEPLRAQLADVDLAPFVDAWETAIDRRVASGTLARETRRHYVAQVRVLFPVDDATEQRRPAWRSALTPDALRAALTALPGSDSSRRRHAAAWASCFTHLVEHGALTRSPLDDVALPANNNRKTPHVERLEDVIRLVHTMPDGAHRAAAAFREGAGVELQVLPRARRRDIVDRVNRVIWAHGSKNDGRDRQVIVEPWAWAILLAYVDANPMTPDALLFPGVTERSHWKAHTAACAALRARDVAIPDRYTPHCCRNTFYIRGLKNGEDPVLLSNNLGHATTAEGLRRYGRFRPAVTDLVRASARGGTQ